jgi:sugar-specific transcriptional regulator TrmB
MIIVKTQTTTIEGVLKSLGLPPFSQKIYRSLLENGETTARFLSESLGITRPSTYDHLEILLKKGLIVKKKIGQMTYFMPDDLRYIGQALERTIEDLEEKKKDFESILPTLLSAQVTEHPKISFYEGKDGLARIISDVLWYKGETVYTLWPYEEMLGVLGEEVHIGKNTKSVIRSKSVSRDGGVSSYRGFVQVAKSADNTKSFVGCDALILDGHSVSNTWPMNKIQNKNADVTHEATVGKIGDAEVHYLMSRGFSRDDAYRVIVGGFVGDIIRALPLEYAVEFNRLVELEMA